MGIQVPAPFAKTALKLRGASPKIMFVAGVAGIVTAGVLACKSTLKLSDALEPIEKEIQLRTEHAEQDEEYANGEFKKDLLKLKIHTVLNIAKLYAPAIGLTVISIGLLTSAQVVQARRTAGMTAAYTAAKEAYDQYRQRVVDKYGMDEDLKLAHGVRVVEETIVGKDGKSKTVTHERSAGYSPYAQLFTEGNPNWMPNSDNNWFFLKSQQNFWNDRLNSYGFVFLNEVYESLGLPRTKEGQLVGWVAGEKNGDGYIDFAIEAAREFMTGAEDSIWLDFNVDGAIIELI